MDEFEMNDIHKEVLTNNRVYLVKNITLDEVFFSELVSNKVFTDEMQEEIQAFPTPSKQVGKMLRMLTKRGPEAYNKFIRILLKMSHGHVAKKLRVTEATERFRRGVKKTMKCDTHMTEKLVLNYTESNTELEKFHEQRVDLLTTQREHTDTRIKELENQLKRHQKETAECRRRTSFLQMDLGRQTELVKSLAVVLHEVTDATQLDLDTVQQKLNQFTAELSTPQVDGFYCHMQKVVDFLANNDSVPVTTEDVPVSCHKVDQCILPVIHIQNLSLEKTAGQNGKKSPSYGSNLSYDRGQSDVRAVTPVGKRKLTSPVHMLTARRPPSAKKPSSRGPSLFARPASGHTESTHYFYNEKSRQQKPAPRQFLLTPPPL